MKGPVIVNKTFIECTGAIMSCLSEHDLTALQAIYASRLAEAERERSQHVRGKPDNLETRWRVLHDICDALAEEQARRSQRGHDTST
jgi:hypothetical protein